MATTTPADSLVRACWAYISGGNRAGQYPAPEMLARHFPDDHVARRLLDIGMQRGASVPASTTTSHWANDIAQSAVEKFIESLMPQSAGAHIIDRGAKVSLGGVTQTKFPKRSTRPAGDLPWVGEGSPIPVRQFTLGSSAVGPACKLAIITCASSELMQAGGQDALGVLLREEGSASLDVAMFSTTAASAGVCAGLLAGVTPTAASTETDATVAMLADMDAIGGAVASATADEVAFVASFATAQKMRRRLGVAGQTAEIWGSPAVADDTLIAVSPRSFASAVSPEPRLEIAKETTLNMAEPAVAISTGTAPTVATPLRSLFQTDTQALKLVLSAAWAMRNDDAVAYIDGIGW